MFGAGDRQGDANGDEPLDVPRSDKFDFDVKVQRGTLTMIVGPVGAGKSTLIKTMLGDVPPASRSNQRLS